jgi:hypothetical protein
MRRWWGLKQRRIYNTAADKTRQDKTREDKTRKDKTWQYKTRQVLRCPFFFFSRLHALSFVLYLFFCLLPCLYDIKDTAADKRIDRRQKTRQADKRDGTWQNKTRQDKTRQDQIKDKTRQDKTRIDETRLRQDTTIQYKTIHDKTRHDKIPSCTRRGTRRDRMQECFPIVVPLLRA